jgi:hypothetical protein
MVIRSGPRSNQATDRLFDHFDSILWQQKVKAYFYQSLCHSQSVLIAILGKGLVGFPTDWLVLNGRLKT